MKIEVGDEELKRIVTALEHYYAFTRAVNRDNSSYQEFADRLKREGKRKR